MKIYRHLRRFRGPAAYLLIQQTHTIINNIQTYYPTNTLIIKINNFKTQSLCPKFVAGRPTPLNTINTTLILNTLLGFGYVINNKSFKKLKTVINKF